MQIKYVKGVDLSPGEIEEAQRRFKELKSEQKGAVPSVQSDLPCCTGSQRASSKLTTSEPRLKVLRWSVQMGCGLIPVQARGRLSDHLICLYCDESVSV